MCREILANLLKSPHVVFLEVPLTPRAIDPRVLQSCLCLSMRLLDLSWRASSGGNRGPRILYRLVR